MKKIGVAILGLGVVGGGTYEILCSHREFYRRTQNVDLEVVCVLEPDRKRTDALGVGAEKIAENIFEVVSNPDVNVVVECIGGVTESRQYVLDALNAGKTVVTSNKELLCKYFHELEGVARRVNAGLYFEASCAGGVPIVRTLLDAVQSNVIPSFEGIVNGTTNYILTKMKEGMSFDEALSEAKALGYAEADVSADADGLDAAYKLSILASLAFHTKVPLTKIYREGIRGIECEDIQEGGGLGYTLKLLALGRQTEHGVDVRVHPAFVENGHPLASVDGCLNAVCLKGDSVGEIVLTGKGAGALPTGSAVVSDILYAATHDGHRYSTFKNTATADKEVKFISDFESKYYLRLLVPASADAAVAAAFAKNNITVRNMLRKTDGERTSVILVTDTAHESAIKKALSRMRTSGIEVGAVIRILA